jgi:hypothetical protein
VTDRPAGGRAAAAGDPAPDAAEPWADVHAAARRIADLGFEVHPDLPDGPGPAYLLVAIRPSPTLAHFDPECVDFWRTDDGRGVHSTLHGRSAMPRELEFSWGRIRIVDRFGVENEWLTFGGTLRADAVEDVVVLVFTSPAPLLRSGGHSQGWDHGADSIGAFFGRLLLAVDYEPGFEARAAEATPLSRYAAFVADVVERYRRSPALRAHDPWLSRRMAAAAVAIPRDHAADWAAGQSLLAAARAMPAARP